MRSIIFIIFAIALLSFPASATFQLKEDFTGISNLSETDFTRVNFTASGNGYGGTITFSDDNAILTPIRTYGGVAIANTSTNWKHVRATVNRTGSYGWIGIIPNSSISLSGTSGYTAVPTEGVYIQLAGQSVYEAYKVGETRYTKSVSNASTPSHINIPGTYDILVNDTGTAVVYVDGVYHATLDTNVTSGAVAIYQGAYTTIPTLSVDSIYASSTDSEVLFPPSIAWSSPSEITTTQYENAPIFSFTSNQTVNYTVTQGESVISGSSTSYEYTPTHDGYGDYTINFVLESNGLVENETQTYTWHYQAAPTNQAPVLTDFSPSSDQTVYQYETVPFSTSIVGATDGYPLLSDVAWSENGTNTQTNTSVTSANYDYVSDTVGDFEISAGVTNAQGSDSESRTVTVLPNSMTISNMEYYPSGDENGVIISFTASDFTSGIPIHGWAPKDFNHTVAGKVYTWNYENGTTIDYKTATSDGEALDFNLSTVLEGNYTIKIVAVPEADFSYTFRMDGTQPVVSFIDNSIGGATSILWDFGDGTTSTEASPTHTYAEEGTYTVTLTRTNVLGTDTKTVSAEISSSLLPGTAFSANTTEGFAPVYVQFTDTSVNATGWNWDFGDGVTSTEQNPLHTYTTEGAYAVTLTASNGAGTSTETKTDYIGIIKSANFTATPESGVAPLTVKFNDTSVNATSWAWDFENDGIIDSTIQNPIHTYGKAGNYSTKLSIHTEKGDTSYISYINVNPTSITLLNQLWWFLYNFNFWVPFRAVI